MRITYIEQQYVYPYQRLITVWKKQKQKLAHIPLWLWASKVYSAVKLFCDTPIREVVKKKVDTDPRGPDTAFNTCTHTVAHTRIHSKTTVANLQTPAGWPRSPGAGLQPSPGGKVSRFPSATRTPVEQTGDPAWWRCLESLYLPMDWRNPPGLLMGWELITVSHQNVLMKNMEMYACGQSMHLCVGKPSQATCAILWTCAQIQWFSSQTELT